MKRSKFTEEQIAFALKQQELAAQTLDAENKNRAFGYSLLGTFKDGSTLNFEFDWSKRGGHMQDAHGITPEIADEALEDPNRVVIAPDYNSESGRSVRIIGFSVTADDVITVIVLENDGTEYGVNGWTARQGCGRYHAPRRLRDW